MVLPSLRWEIDKRPNDCEYVALPEVQRDTARRTSVGLVEGAIGGGLKRLYYL